MREFFNRRRKGSIKYLWIPAFIYSLLMQGCISSQRMIEAVHGHYYQYKFSMRESDSRKKAIWDKNGVKMTFTPVYNRINFSLENKSGSPVEILWNKSSMVQENDSSAIIHGGVTLNSDPGKQPPSRIVENQSLQDFILPLLLIEIKDRHLSIRDLYPEKDDELSEKNDWIMHLIGQNLFRLHLVLKINGKQQQVTLNFYPIEIMRGAHSFKTNQ